MSGFGTRRSVAPEFLPTFGVVGGAADLYFGVGTASATEADVSFAAPYACHLKQLYVRHIFGASTFDITVRKGGVDTAVAITGATGTATSEATGDVAFAKGDLITVHSVRTAGVGSNNLRGVLRFSKDNA